MTDRFRIHRDTLSLYPLPPKIAAYVIVGEGGGAKRVYSKIEFFWDLILWFYAVLPNYVWGAVYLLN